MPRTEIIPTPVSAYDELMLEAIPQSKQDIVLEVIDEYGRLGIQALVNLYYKRQVQQRRPEDADIAPATNL